MYIFCSIYFSCCRSGREKPLLAKLAELDRKLFQVSCPSDPSGILLYREWNPYNNIATHWWAAAGWTDTGYPAFYPLKKNVFKKKVSYTLTLIIFAKLVYIVYYIVCCKKLKSACPDPAGYHTVIYGIRYPAGCRTGYQCGGSGSVESVSFPWIRIRIKKWLDPESGSVRYQIIRIRIQLKPLKT